MPRCALSEERRLAACLRRSAELCESVGARYSASLMRSAARALDPAAELDGDLIEVMREAPGGRRSFGELL
jgi:hypothetical protein